MKIEDFISVDKVNYDGHFKHIATGAFQYVEPPIESMFRENAVIYFFRWLEMNGMDLEADYNDDDKMAEYGEGFAKYVASGNITLSIPPEPERIYVTLGQANLPSSGGPSRMMDEVLSNLSDDATLGGISQTGAFTDPGNLPQNPSGRASPLHGAGSERLGSRTADPFDLDRLMVELNRDGAQNAVDLLAPAGRDSNLFPSNRDTYSARSAPVGISQRNNSETRDAARDQRIKALLHHILDELRGCFLDHAQAQVCLHQAFASLGPLVRRVNNDQPSGGGKGRQQALNRSVQMPANDRANALPDPGQGQGGKRAKKVCVVLCQGFLILPRKMPSNPRGTKAPVGVSRP